jgi:hypothetical protein
MAVKKIIELRSPQIQKLKEVEEYLDGAKNLLKKPFLYGMLTRTGPAYRTEADMACTLLREAITTLEKMKREAKAK